MASGPATALYQGVGASPLRHKTRFPQFGICFAADYQAHGDVWAHGKLLTVAIQKSRHGGRELVDICNPAAFSLRQS